MARNCQRSTLGCWDKGGRISGRRLFSNYVQFTIISGKNSYIKRNVGIKPTLYTNGNKKLYLKPYDF